MALADELVALEPFRGYDVRALAPLAAALTVHEHGAGAVLLRQGEPGDRFQIVLDGCVSLSRRDDDGVSALGRAGPGSIVGELAMLTGHPRVATATSETPVRTAVGDTGAFAQLVDLPGMSDHLARLVAGRLAEVARTVPVTLRDGSAVGLRPLVPQDRDDIVELIGRQTADWRRARFFVGGRPPDRTIDHLVNIDYLNHFAWVAVPEGSNRSVGVGRYVRLSDDPGAAEVAFGVAAEHQGRGTATMLLGALGVIAATAGITRFTAEVLRDNGPMRAVFRRAEARWTSLEGGVLSMTLPVAAAARLVDGDLAAALVRTARDIATGAGLALTRPARA
jgi:CRP-like cAMP-binding protein